MSLNLENRTFETNCGTWRTSYIGEPDESGDNVEFWIRFKWVDPHDPDNKATPERRLRLLTYPTQTVNDDYENRLFGAIRMWLDSDEDDTVFDYEQHLLRVRDRS